MKDRVALVDVSARDGFQDEPSFVATADKVGVAAALHAAGVGHVEITSFVHPRWVPASPRHALANNNRTIEETLENFDAVAALAKREGIALRGALACAFVSPWPQDERLDRDEVVRVVRRFATGGVNGVTLADTVGFADPRTVAQTVVAVRDATGVPLSLHLHDAHGYALANVYAGLEVGVRSFEGALAGLGGCPWAPGAPGNLDLERLNRFLGDCGCETGVDPEKLAVARDRVRAALAVAVPIVREQEAARR